MHIYPENTNTTKPHKTKHSNSFKKYEKLQEKGKSQILISTIKQMKKAIVNQILFTKKVNVVNNASQYKNFEENELKYTNGENKVENEEEKEINFIIDEYLGDGTFGAVSRIRLLTTEQISLIEKSNAKFSENASLAYKRVFEETNHHNREISILKTLNHENIIKIFAYNYSPLKNYDELGEEGEGEGRFANLYLEYVPYTLHVFIKYGRTRFLSKLTEVYFLSVYVL